MKHLINNKKKTILNLNNPFFSGNQRHSEEKLYTRTWVLWLLQAASSQTIPCSQSRPCSAVTAASWSQGWWGDDRSRIFPRKLHEQNICDILKKRTLVIQEPPRYLWYTADTCRREANIRILHPPNVQPIFCASIEVITFNGKWSKYKIPTIFCSLLK